MNYTAILLDGILDANNREFFSEYLQDELLKSKQSPPRFYSGCKKAVTQLKTQAENRFNHEKSRLYKLQMYGSDEGKQYAKSELEEFNPDNYPLNLSHHYPGYYYSITYSLIVNIETTIDILKTSSSQKQKEGITKFEQLFKSPEIMQKCIDVLKVVDPPIINNKEQYIGRSKGAICIWTEEINRRGLFEVKVDDKIRTALINNKIKQLSIEESNFRKEHKRAREKYGLEFKQKLSQISHSENRES
jgi:hypothetical protein